MPKAETGHRLPRALGALAILVVGQGLPGLARAQDPTPADRTGQTGQAPTPAKPSPADEQGASTLVQQGHERFRAGDYRGALSAFLAAHRLVGLPTTGLEVARTAAQLGLLLEARYQLLRVVRTPRRPDEPESHARARIEAEALSRQIEARLPALQVEVLGPSGPLSAQPAVRLKIDGVDIAPELRLSSRRLNPGAHLVQVSAPGFAPQRHKLLLQEREQRVLQLTLLPATEDDADEPTEGDDETESTGISPVAWVGFGIGAAGLVAGAITGGITLSRAAALDEQCPEQQCPPDQRDAVRTAITLGDASTACFIVGGLGVGVGLASLLMSLYGQEEPGASGRAASGTTLGFELRPWLGVGPAVVGVTGTF
jgi:hypothetical protein